MVKISLTQQSHNSIMSIEGELTDRDISALESELGQWLETRHAGSELILDLSECSFIDSKASQVLVEVRNKVPKEECTIILIPGENPGVRNVISLTCMDQHFAIPVVVAIG